MFVFDAYGTLLDVDAAAREAAAEPGMEALKENWLPIAKGWRERQLRYSWLCSMMGKYDDFWELTIRALDTTLEEHALASNDKVRARLLSLYSELSAYEEVPEVLANLKAAGHRLAVLSNASPSMLVKALDAAGISEWFDELLSVDVLKCYKPTPAVYQLIPERFDCKPSDVTFFSSNNWDVSGAGAFGFQTVWVNRSGLAWDNLPGKPDSIVKSISEAQLNI
ncbi:haloacid dehalogenase type II [Alphaproteobacteria bacterium]|nr:haloacid dehalogenase type II [Alphaproteobacteria bacterium]